jgi:hypothetical protein
MIEHEIMPVKAQAITPTEQVEQRLQVTSPRMWLALVVFWKLSGINAFDLVSPERTSKNIGDFCVVMPGQEQVVMTKEVIVLRPGPKANFDAFYLLWAMTLKIVRDQWKRVIFMQTNREDVGKRYLEIRVPIPPSAERATTMKIGTPGAAESERRIPAWPTHAGSAFQSVSYLRRD